MKLFTSFTNEAKTLNLISSEEAASLSQYLHFFISRKASSLKKARSRVLFSGRGRRTRTLKNGFGDRYVTITSCPYSVCKRYHTTAANKMQALFVFLHELHDIVVQIAVGDALDLGGRETLRKKRVKESGQIGRVT